MLKAKVGYSTNIDSYIAGTEASKMISKELNPKFSFVYTSEKNNIKEVINSLQENIKTPFIGCTSHNGIIVEDGIISSTNGFVGMMSFEDKNMTVGVAIKEAGKDARAVGRRVAIEAVENAKTTRAPAYFYMVASPKTEEEYLMGIQDVIGRVPCFGGSAADEEITENWKIFTNNKIINDGVAVAFFYTDNEIVTAFNGCYRETNNIGIITEVKNNIK